MELLSLADIELATYLRICPLAAKGVICDAGLSTPAKSDHSTRSATAQNEGAPRQGLPTETSRAEALSGGRPGFLVRR